MAKQTEFTAEEAWLILNGTDGAWVDYILAQIANGVPHRTPHLEPYIIQYPRAAYTYSKVVIYGRWPEAEPIIAQHPWEAWYYAFNIIHGRFPEAEPAIDKDPVTKKLYDDYLGAIGKRRK